MKKKKIFTKQFHHMCNKEFKNQQKKLLYLERFYSLIVLGLVIKADNNLLLARLIAKQNMILRC